MPLIAGLLAVALFLLSKRLGATDRSAVAIGAGGVIGTYALPYGKDFFSEPPTCLFLALAFERALSRRPVAAGVLLGCACLVRPQSFMIAPLLLGVLAWRQGPRAAAGALAPIAVTAAVQAGLNQARFGSPLEFGYGEAGFTTGVLTGLRGLLLEPTKSVVIFAPVVVLLAPALRLLWRRDRAACVLLAGTLAITVGTTAAWTSWAGGWSWGPRLLLPGILTSLPAVAVWMDARRLNARIALTALALGFTVSASTLIVPVRAQQLDGPGARVGPDVVRQMELIGPVLSYTAGHALSRAGNDRAGEHRRFVNTWHVGAARELGRAGLLVALPVTLVLAGALLAALRQLVVVLRPAWPRGVVPGVRDPA
jgi:hypothetical protein